MKRFSENKIKGILEELYNSEFNGGTNHAFFIKNSSRYIISDSEDIFGIFKHLHANNYTKKIQDKPILTYALNDLGKNYYLNELYKKDCSILKPFYESYFSMAVKDVLIIGIALTSLIITLMK